MFLITGTGGSIVLCNVFVNAYSFIILLYFRGPQEVVGLSLMLTLSATASQQYQYYTSNDALEDLYEMELALLTKVGEYIQEQQNILTLLIG